LVSALNRVDLPTLGRPTIPIDRLTNRESSAVGGDLQNAEVPSSAFCFSESYDSCTRSYIGGVL
jgi:hypothetical protein